MREKLHFFAACTSVFWHTKITSYYFVHYINNGKMRSHRSYGPLQVSKSLWTTGFLRSLHVDFSHWLVSVLWHWVGKVPGKWRQWARKSECIQWLQTFCKRLSTQSMWSILLCFHMKVNHLNILTNFSEITNTIKRFYCILRLGKKMYLSFWHTSFSHKKEHIWRNVEAVEWGSKDGSVGLKNTVFPKD